MTLGDQADKFHLHASTVFVSDRLCCREFGSVRGGLTFQNGVVHWSAGLGAAVVESGSVFECEFV
jgi:hypothetical protein